MNASNSIAAEAKIATAFISKDNGKFEIHVEGISPSDVVGFYVDNSNIDKQLAKKKAIIERNGNGFIMTIDYSLVKQGKIFYIDTTQGWLNYEINDALVKIEQPAKYSVQPQASRSQASSVSNNVTIYGHTNFYTPNKWWGCSKSNASGAYIRIRRDLYPAVDYDTYANSSGDYTKTYPNLGGNKIIFSVKKSGVSNWTTKSVCTKGPCAYKINLDLYYPGCL